MPRDNRPSGQPPRRQFNFVKSTAAEVNEILTSRPQSSFDSTIEGARMFYPKNGEHIVRILPWHGQNHFAMGTPLTPPAIWEHRFVGVHNSNYLCLSHMLRKRCPICEEARALQAREPEKAKKIAAKSRLYFYVLDRRSANANEPQVWNVWDRLHRSILLQTKSSRGDVINPADPNEGYDMVFLKTSTGPQMADYDGFRFDQQPCPIFDDSEAQQKLLEWLMDHPLPSLLHYKTAEYLDEIMTGTSPEHDELDDRAETAPEPEPEQEEAPRHHPRAAAPPPPSAASNPLPNGDEDDEDPEDDEDEVDEPDIEEPEEEDAAPPSDPPLRRRPEPAPASERQAAPADRQQRRAADDRRRPSGNGEDGRARPRSTPSARPAAPSGSRPGGSRYNRD